MSNTDQAFYKSERMGRVMEGIGIWASYYRSNPHRFATDFLHLKLKLFQIILLFVMNISASFVFIGSRGLGKSFLCAVYCVTRAILYPGSKIIIASGTRSQSANVLEKIMTELKPLSPELAYEIDEKETKVNSTNAQIVFKNASYIKVVTASDNARGNRAHVLIIDEFRMVKKDVIDTILRKFLANPRHPKYMDNPEYSHMREPLKTMYLSSAYYQDHWSFVKARDTCRFMLDERRTDFVCGFPYQLALKEELLMEDTVIEQMTETDFNEIKWAMEMDSVFFGDNDGSFFGYESVAKNRRIAYAMLPDRLSAKLGPQNKFRIPNKAPGEYRILSADIALMASTRHKNDATAIMINQCMPTKAQRLSNNIVYTETLEGMITDELALYIRKLFEEFDCDYIVLDCKGVGISVYDALARELNDPETGELYPALSCCNNADLAARCADRYARKAIWAIMGSAKLNSDCALLLREGFKTGRIRLLSTEYDAEELYGSMKAYTVLNPSERSQLMLPYINTTLMINELINLRHEENAGNIRLIEKSGARKDRYSSLSYNYYVATQIEKEIRRSKSRSVTAPEDTFIIRAPRIFKERW